MSKRVNRKFKISRRLGEAVWGSQKDPVVSRNSPPGQHGASGYKKPTDYGIQLSAKQKLKKYYGDITEKQFRNIYKNASRKRGDTAQNIIGMLESRLDAFIYRMGIVSTIFAARQFVSHKHVMVNGRKVNIASYRLSVGDVVSVVEKAKSFAIVQQNVESSGACPDYLQFDKDSMSATYVRVPAISDVPYPVVMQPNLVVEFYSR
ncbi:30S ribosomal protein S4 [Candidatus Cyrtobacter comes]|uniref:Small ribosomal subunit protein uS4 n=1 Tax=Candidatus Cyrtobacter comes TaxID=675776 RepID=A0ABU5LA05_9RICK|nr:30S ribosomal protein S4 [Candidatus Cyrtobacter comes]MDZ5762730.1 30S ribosomal protein S4 [Candidatus Cyrtobacter comes]